MVLPHYFIGTKMQQPPQRNNNSATSQITEQHVLISSKPYHFDENQLPSCVRSKLTPEEERSKRMKTCRFIEEASRILRLPRVATSTALVFFHRFYAVHSFAEHDRFEVAVACILIAAKTEESPRKLAHVIQECWKLKNSAKKNVPVVDGSNTSNVAGDTNTSTSSNGDMLSPPTADNISPRLPYVDKSGFMDTKSEEFVSLKERILLLERVILHTIGFELSVDHPYKFLVDLCKRIVPSRLIEYTNPTIPSPTTKSMMNDLVQCSMNFANDSMHTSLCLQYPPKAIAITCVYMSCQVCKMKPIENKTWVDILGSDIDMDILARKFTIVVHE